jgi:hypothetical protein
MDVKWNYDNFPSSEYHMIVEESGDHIENVYTMTTINGLKMFFFSFFKIKYSLWYRVAPSS